MALCQYFALNGTNTARTNQGIPRRSRARRRTVFAPGNGISRLFRLAPPRLPQEPLLGWRLSGSSPPPKALGTMWSTTSGIPITRREVRQYSQRCPARAKTCWRNTSDNAAMATPVAAQLKEAQLDRASAGPTRQRLCAASSDLPTGAKQPTRPAPQA